ncbi:4Fe-4S dicluster domain-containing protein [Chakrabartyella piscis]|uniref:4Fe-4S dicluster domain-containing protein n=1 Tax=Chakrabartyella piscis TaxID=2918914 RepID=UPI002958361F|nr:4Fe-4S dicluster domain-containing protein [Chakrabartyella piscis]
MKTVTIDPKKCVGCRNCEMSCAYAQTGEDCIRTHANIRVNNYSDDRFVLPMTCFHCEEAWCMNVCPANAISRNGETGAVMIDQTKCAGCKMCILACPFGNIHFDHVALVSRKCDLCGGDPQCVKHCIAEALNFEEIDDLAERKRIGIDERVKMLAKKQ